MVDGTLWPMDKDKSASESRGAGRDALRWWQQGAARELESLADAAALAERIGLRPRPDDDPFREDFGDESTSELRYIAAFRLAYEFATRVAAALAAERGPRRLWWRLDHEARRIAIEIAAGHGIGYESEFALANAARCQAALAHAERSAALLRELRDREGRDDEIEGLLALALFVRLALEERIIRAESKSKS